MAHLLFRNLELIGPPQFDKEEEKFAKDLQAAYGFSQRAFPPNWSRPPGDGRGNRQL